MKRNRCPTCDETLEYRKASWQQYKPAEYYCTKCKATFSPVEVQLKTLEKDNKAFRLENNKLKEALEFYADPANWIYSNFEEYDRISSDDLGDIKEYASNKGGGKTAREALK